MCASPFSLDGHRADACQEEEEDKPWECAWPSALVRMSAGCHPTHICRKEKDDAHTVSYECGGTLIEIIIEGFLVVYE